MKVTSRKWKDMEVVFLVQEQKKVEMKENNEETNYEKKVKDKNEN